MNVRIIMLIYIRRKDNMKKIFNELETLITCGGIAYILLRIVESL